MVEGAPTRATYTFPVYYSKGSARFPSSSSIYLMEAFFKFIQRTATHCIMASASHPPKPADLTTPVQQRIVINGPNGELCP
jgi:hypothetical protein